MSEIFRGRIREIVQGSDLALLSSKKIREQLEQEFKTDLSKRKKEIDDIVMSLLVSESQNEDSQNSTDDDDESDDENPATLNSQPEKRKKGDAHTKKKKAKGRDSCEDEAETESTKRVSKKSSKTSAETTNNEFQSRVVLVQELADVMGLNSGDSQTKNKKAKTRDSSEDEAEITSKDEELARKLQGEDGTRTTRRQLKGPKKKESTKKESKKSSKTPAKKDNMFQKEMVLSQELADIMGVNSMPRSKVVQRMWQIVKERNLSDPTNKQFHICDDQLMKVFGKRRVRTFSMMKYLKTHIKDPDLLTSS